MKAVDTNVLIRWITRDDPRQTPTADTVLAFPVFVSLTVLIEVAWVLRGRLYRYSPVMTCAALETLLALETVTMEADEWVRWALRRHAAGADLPDMLHLIAADVAESFVTFEKHLAADAGDAPPIPVETLS